MASLNSPLEICIDGPKVVVYLPKDVPTSHVDGRLDIGMTLQMKVHQSVEKSDLQKAGIIFVFPGLCKKFKLLEIL